MIVWTSAERPAVLTVRFLDRQIINAGNTTSHKAIFVEFPVLVAIRTEPVARVVVPLIGKAYCDPILLKSPELLDEAVIQLLCPLALKELHDRCAP